jgi:hypothetical protein
MKAMQTLAAFRGSSSTAGKGQAFDRNGELERRPGSEQFRFLNFGGGGSLAYNRIQRLVEVLAVPLA